MTFLGKIKPEKIDLKELIFASSALDEMQKTQLLILATQVPKEELSNLLNLLNNEKKQMEMMHTNYQMLIERFEQKAEEQKAESKEQAEVDRLLNQLNDF